jgi:hypothetical protein
MSIAVSKIALLGFLIRCFLLEAALFDHYVLHICQRSDIHEHLPALKELASTCSSVAEIGLREMESTWGILQGLSESPHTPRSYLGIDIAQPPLQILHLARRCAEEHGISFDFWQANDMEIDMPQVDMLFIDSLHTYCHLSYELELFSPKVRRYIAMHDTSAPWGEADDVEYQGDRTEYPKEIDRTKRGLWAAVEDFLSRHPEWILQDRFFNCHGFTVLRRNGS